MAQSQIYKLHMYVRIRRKNVFCPTTTYVLHQQGNTAVSLDTLVLNNRDCHEESGNRIFCTSKHTLKQALLDKSQLKCSSNTVVILQ